MEIASIIQLVSRLAVLYAQEAPLLGEARAALESGDPAVLEALLAKVQAENDELGLA